MSSSSSSSNANNVPTPKELDNLLVQYLQSRGYARAEELVDELSSSSTTAAAAAAAAPSAGSSSSPSASASLTPSEMVAETMRELHTGLRRAISDYNRRESNPQWYEESYTRLRSWLDASLDMYRNELVPLLWPVYVHIFLRLLKQGFPNDAAQFLQAHRGDHEALHASELMALQTVMTWQQVEHNEVAREFCDRKLEVGVSAHSQELLLSMLTNSRLMLLIKIINDHITLKVVSREPLSSSSLHDGARRGISAELRTVYWGALPSTVDLHQAARHMAADLKARPGSASEPPNKKLKSYKTAIPQLPRATISEEQAVPLPYMDDSVRAKAIEDLAQRIALDPNTAERLPSVCFYTFLNCQAECNSIDMNHDGSLVCGGFSDASLRVWNLKDPRTFKQPDDNAQGAGKDEDDGADDDEGLGLVRKPEAPYTRFVGHYGAVYSSSFSPDSRFMLSASEDATCRLWTYQPDDMAACLAVYKGHNYPIWDVQFSPIGTYFATASHDRTARVWATNYTHPLRILAGHYSDVNCVQFHPNSGYVATGSTDKTVRLWDVQTGTCVRVFNGHSGGVCALAFSECGQFLASGAEDGRVVQWDIGNGQAVNRMAGHKGAVTSVSWERTGKLVASGGLDCTVRLWDVKKRQESTSTFERPIRTFPTKSTPVTYVHFTRRNLLLASGVFTI